MEVLIVRHGQSWTNLVTSRPASQGSPGLTRLGFDQARECARFLGEDVEANGAFSTLYCSPRLRALETATVIAGTLGLTPMVAKELRSLDHGPGNPWNPGNNASGTIPPLAPRTPALVGAETWESYLGRAGRFLTGLPARHPGSRVLIVGHAETQTAAISAFLRLKVDSGSWWRAQVEHGGICRWAHEHQQVRGADRDGCWILAGHNETRHLDSCLSPTPRVEVTE